jgi:subtilisin family serine protease
MSIKPYQWQMIWRGFSLIVVAAMLVGLGAGGVTAPAKAASPVVVTTPAPIDPDVYVGLEQKGSADVLVILKEQADLSGAADIQTKTLKGYYVYEQLTSVAERTQSPLKEFLDSQGATYRAYWIQNMLRVTVDLDLLKQISYQPGIKYIEFYHEPYPDVMGNDLGKDFGPEYGPFAPVKTEDGNQLASWTEFGPASPEAVEWNITRVGAEDVWALGITGGGAVVGDLDSGVQWDHPALVNQYRPQIPGAPTRHDYNWFDGLDGSATPVDYDGHGTHTMGTIVGDDGGANQIGMAPGAQWIACAGIGSPYVDPFGCFEFFMAPTELDGSNPRPDLAPHVISNSWSSAGTDYHGAIQSLYAAGIYFSKSAGNTGSSCSTITNPGQWPEVTATAAFAQGDTIASFSSRGPVYLGYDVFMKPDIAAPGVNVRSSYPTNTYSNLQGTSMACPHITGAVALLISANPELAGQIDILQMLLKTTAEPKIDAQCTPFVDHPNDVWGWGILDIYAAVQKAQTVALGGIDGVVYDSATSDPIPGASVTYTKVDDDWPFYDTADENGAYEATLVAETYDLSAEAYGYLPSTESGVIVEEGLVTTQDINLDPAPVWTVSGVVTETQSGDPLAATLEFVDTPVSTTSPLETGQYSADIFEGTYWFKVTSPGHKTEVVQVTVDQDLVVNFSLEAIDNYYMRQEECQPAFSWLDATGGTQLTLGDDAAVLYSLPAGKSIDFYGNTYTQIWIGSNGIVTFGASDSKWSGPIPDPATPNNGIYAFSTDLYPGVGNGKVYRTIIDDRYLVIEWYQVEHYPSGNPETFEIVIDFETNVVKIQYLDVSDASLVVSGVENSTGTEATQYAYDDPTLIADNAAVVFYPAFGTPPPLATLRGLITDSQSGDPIKDAWAFATAFTTGNTYYFKTDDTGNYAGEMCADIYTVWADKAGYAQSAEVELDILDGTANVQDFELDPIPGFTYSPEELIATIDGEGSLEEVLTFGNTGSDDIDFSLEVSPTVTWLDIEPMTGTVTPGVDQELAVTFDSTGLAAGIYETVVKVTTTDPEFLLFDIPVMLTVTCTPISDLDFSFLPGTPLEGETTTFTATASGAPPILFAWDFGDENTGMGEVVTHTYEVAGTYTVTLTAANCAGDDVVVEYVITVLPAAETWNLFLPIVWKN